MQMHFIINNKQVMRLFSLLVLASLIHIDAKASDTTSVKVANIIIEGNKRTKSFIIERELDMEVGTLIDTINIEERLMQNQKRVFNTTLFVEVKVSTKNKTKESIDIVVVVKENWYVWSAPFFTFNDRNFNEWVDRGSDLGRLNYGAFIVHRNFLGRMQKLEFVFETGFTDRLTVRYNIPYIDKRGKSGIYSEFRIQSLSNLNYTTNNNQLDFIYNDKLLKTQFESKIKYRYRNGFYAFHYAEIGYNDTSISDTLRDININYLSNQSNIQKFATLAYTFRYDKRDNINFPLKGRALIAEIRRFGILKSDNFNSWQFKLAYADYYPLKNKWYFNYILKASAYSNPDIPYNLLQGIGYEENILRGYDLFVVNGSAFASGRVNLKKELFKRTYNLKFVKWRQFNTLPVNIFLNGFVDAGYVYNKNPERIGNSLNNNRLTSYGFGLELNTAYNGTIKFNLSRNTLNQTNFFINFQKDIWIKSY
jgi:outer membrane protein assembly factor BamA